MFDCLSEQVQKMKLIFFPDEAQYEIFTDPITGKQYIRTEDGELLEIVVGEDGKTYLKTKSGKLRGISQTSELERNEIFMKSHFQIWYQVSSCRHVQYSR